MKNLLTIGLSILFCLFSAQSFSQIVTPSNEVCPGDTVEYTFNSSYTGIQQFGVSNGKFIVADSLYIGPNDSTMIELNVDSISKVKILWKSINYNGTVYWYELNELPTSQNIPFYSSTFSRLYAATDTIALNGSHRFTISIKEYDAVNNYTNEQYSSNIDLIGLSLEQVPYSDDIILKYTFQITGTENGWVKFISGGPASQNCPFITNNTINVNISRKLNKPSITGASSLCNNESDIYYLSGDSQTNTYEWNVTNGLEIAVAPPYYYTTGFESTETSWPIVNHTSTSGLAEIKVIAHAPGYVDSDESVKQIWLGYPLPDDLYIIGLDNYGNSVDLGDGTFEVCEDQYYTFYLAPVYNLPTSHHRYGITSVNFHFDFNYTYITGGYGWAYIRVNNIDGSSVGLVDVVGCSTINEFLDFGILEGDCGYYYMTFSPNPSNEYIEISFVDEKDIKDNTNKIKIKKDKNVKDGIGDYLIQILDKDGNILKSVQSNTMQTILNIRDIAPGNYFLHLTLGNEKYKEQIIIY